MKNLLLICTLISLNCFSQTVKIPPSKDTTVITFKTTYSTSTNTTYTTATIPVKVDTIIVPPPPPPVPSAYEGFGSQAQGGSGFSDVRLVANKAQFDAAIGSNRTIKFTSNASFIGRYDLINISYLTIDANGFDVTIDNNNNGDGISFDGPNTHHCILKGIRVINAGNDGINVLDGAHDILIDHCSSYDNRDGNIDIAGANRVTVQYCFIGRGKTGFAGCSLITSTNVSFHHNLLSPLGSPAEGERLPFVHCNYSPVGNPNADIRNNVMYSWGRSGGTGSGYATAIGYNAVANVVNNYYYDKESASSAVANGDGYGTGATGKIYSAGNYITNGSTAFLPTMGNNRTEVIISDPYKIATQTATDAKAKVKAEVGTAIKNTYELSIINAI